MIASGLLLWSLKRQLQNKTQQFHLGHYLVDRLNVATFVGLPLAMMGYFYTNRLVYITSDMPNYEIYSFFIFWGLSLVTALFTPKQWLWRSQLVCLIVMAAFLPVFDLFYLVRHQYIQSIVHYWTFFRVDLFFILLAVLAYFILKNIHPIQTTAKQKIIKKLSSAQEVKA
jgi:hypothetical protein